MFAKISSIGSPFRGAAWPSPDKAVRESVVGLDGEVEVKIDSTIGPHFDIIDAMLPSR